MTMTATHTLLNRVYGFAGGGAPDATSDQELADAACEAMETPDARLTEACANALWTLAQSEADVSFSGSGEALRRLGYVADRLAHMSNAPALLKVWAAELWQGAETTPLVLTDTVSRSRLTRLQSEGDSLSARWNVWGKVARREEFL